MFSPISKHLHAHYHSDIPIKFPRLHCFSLLILPQCKEEELEEPVVSESSESTNDVPDMFQLQKMKPGTFVLQSNEYFTIEHHPEKYLRVRLRVKWLQELGHHEKSKTVQPEEFDANLDVAVLVLRAWVLDRMKHQRFLQKKSIRTAWYEQQVEDMRKVVAEVNVPGSTGCLEADQWIRECVPEVLH